jgi:hypothetical protein
MRLAFHFIEARPARIGTRRSADHKKLAQFRNLILRVVSQVFDNGRLFCGIDHDCLSPPHLAYLLLIPKDERNQKMFHGLQRFLGRFEDNLAWELKN